MLIFFIVLLVFLADQVSKDYVNKKIKPGTYVEVIKDKFYLTNVKNTGAAYGFLKNNRKLLMAVTAASFTSLLVIFRGVFHKNADVGEKVSFALVFGGAIGNLYDRLQKKKVTDFIYIKIRKAPIFNLADTAILLGTVWMLFKEMRRK